MKYLIDTHIWLWYLTGSNKLSAKMLSSIDNPQNQIYLSPISIWETLILAAKKRIELPQPHEEWIKKVLEKNFFHEASLTHAVALESRKVKLTHEDPADRFLAASCIIYGLKMLTEDRLLKRYQ